MKSSDKKNTILVTGVTGSQGGAVAQALLDKGNSVRIMVRVSSRTAAGTKKLESAGAEVVIADLEDKESVAAAMKGINGLFSVQAMDDGTDSERRHADTLISTATAAGVEQIVHVSASGAGSFESFPGWGSQRWNEQYWTGKRYAEERIQNSGIPHWTIFRPTFFMDNFIPPKAAFIYQGLDTGELPVVFSPKKKLQFIDVADTAAFVTAAFNELPVFDRKIIDLAGDERTIEEIVDHIGVVTGKRVKINYCTEEEAIEKGMRWPLANFQQWTNIVGYNVDIKELEKYGIPLTTFEQYFQRNKDLLVVRSKDPILDEGIAVVKRNTEEVQSKGNFAIFDELFSPDFIDHTPQPGGFAADRDSVRALYTMLRRAFPDFRAVIHWQTSDGDRVTTFKTYYGTHLGPIFGLAATGRQMHFESVDVMRVREGQITDHWGVGNLLSMMQQLGGLPNS